MADTTTSKQTFQVRDGDFRDASAFVNTLLLRKDISRETASETLLVFEALMQKIVDWGLSEDTDLEISGTSSLGDFRIKIGFEGKLFAHDNSEGHSPEDKTLDAYDDKLDYSYHSGYNTITISVSRSNHTSLFACIIASLCAVIVYALISFQVDANTQKDLLSDYVVPLETMYANAMLMVGAPMTLFSLLKNLTDAFIISQRYSNVRRLQAKTLATSVLAALLAVATFFLLSNSLLAGLRASSPEFGVSVDRTFGEIVTSLVPSSILEPFEAVLPIPLMVIALLSTYALCSSGKYFDSLRYAIMACYTLFSRMLHVLIAALPVFCFLAIMDVLLDAGLEWLAVDLLSFVLVCLSMLLLYATYAIRLRVRGIKVLPFVRTLVPLLAENYRIGSAINAAPYNIRYCSNNFRMNRTMLENNIPVLAEINLDGNCFILMSLSLIFIFSAGADISWIVLVGVELLVLFLSYGAPNQPGSILIGVLLIAMYLQSFDVVCMAILAEGFLGSVQNLTNVIGDIVMVAIEDKKEFPA